MRLPRPGRLPAETAEQLSHHTLPDGRVLGLFEALAHSPAAFTDLRRATATCLAHTRIPLREREILILRTLALAGAEAEWAVHVALFAREAGLTPAELSTVASDRGALSAPDMLIVRLADALHHDRDVDDDLWRELRDVYSPAHVVELLLICAQYAKVATLTKALRVPVPAGLPGFPT